MPLIGEHMPQVHHVIPLPVALLAEQDRHPQRTARRSALRDHDPAPPARTLRHQQAFALKLTQSLLRRRAMHPELLRQPVHPWHRTAPDAFKDVFPEMSRQLLGGGKQAKRAHAQTCLKIAMAANKEILDKPGRKQVCLIKMQF